MKEQVASPDYAQPGQDGSIFQKKTTFFHMVG
jgi:hypothetical protein